MKTLKEEIVGLFQKCGADIVRFGAAEACKDPAVLKLMPEAKTVICAAFRQLRGARRGIEEGSTYYQYTTNAVEVLEENVMPVALLRGSALLEDRGFEALPQRRSQLIMHEENSTNFEMNYQNVYRGKTAENMLDFEQCALDCHLGEMGESGSILTDEFGPCQRYVFIITDAEIEPDKAIEPHLCDKCGKCVAACPGNALKSGKRDPWQCAVYYNGANRSKNPFMPETAYGDFPDRQAIMDGTAVFTGPEDAGKVLDASLFYPRIKHSYVASICGRACDTACYIHLEEQGKLERKFQKPFRLRPEWKLED